MTQTKAAPFTLPELPYAQNALAPALSAKTLNIHYGKHHKGYVERLNAAVSGTRFADMPLEELIVKTAGRPGEAAIFNNAAQVWNHDFYWQSLSPKGGGEPKGELSRKIEFAFESYANFIKQFSEIAATAFGSGWVWLMEDEGRLQIVATSNADNPSSLWLGRALLAVDVWEHAYYLDYQNRRKDYVEALLRKSINWRFAERNLAG